MKTHQSDLQQNLDSADKWIKDGLSLVKQAGFSQTIEVDMTYANSIIDHYKAKGVSLTHIHLIIKFTSEVLSSSTKLHQLISGYTYHYPNEVDIGLSVAGSRCVAPIMVLKSTDKKSLVDISKEIRTRIKSVKKEHEQFMQKLNKWGWLAPFGWIRRSILKTFIGKYDFIKNGSGTFQITSANQTDSAIPYLFNTQAILCIGKVKLRPIVIDGQLTVKPTAILTCACDHSVWDGRRCSQFLTGLKDLLENNNESIDMNQHKMKINFN